VNTFPLVISLFAYIAISSAHAEVTTPPYKAYWVKNKELGEYVDLILANRSLKEMPKAAVTCDKHLLEVPGIIVRTYARDSIWNVDRRPFKPLAGIEKVGADSMTIKGQEFSYTEAKMEDVLRLLENPEGIISIHRMYAPVSGQEEFVKSLVLRIKQQVEEMRKK